MNFVYRALEYLCNKWIMRDGMMLRETMAQRGVKKQLGCSMIEVNDEIHICFPHDQWHPDGDICTTALHIIVDGEAFIPKGR